MKVRNEDNKDKKKNNAQKYQVKNESDSICVQINKPRVLFIVFFFYYYINIKKKEFNLIILNIFKFIFYPKVNSLKFPSSL